MARPQLSDDLIRARAKAIKRLESREVEPKARKSARKIESTPKQENEVVVSGGDLYPAEMSLFETLETYLIRATITCVATFSGSQK